MKSLVPDALQFLKDFRLSFTLSEVFSIFQQFYCREFSRDNISLLFSYFNSNSLTLTMESFIYLVKVYLLFSLTDSFIYPDHFILSIASHYLPSLESGPTFYPYSKIFPAILFFFAPMIWVSRDLSSFPRLKPCRPFADRKKAFDFSQSFLSFLSSISKE